MGKLTALEQQTCEIPGHGVPQRAPRPDIVDTAEVSVIFMTKTKPVKLIPVQIWMICIYILIYDFSLPAVQRKEKVSYTTISISNVHNITMVKEKRAEISLVNADNLAF